MSVEIFLKFGDISGEAQDTGHKEWIEVLSYTLGFTPSIQGTPNLGSAAGKVNFQDLTFTVLQSKASPKLMEGCCTGQHFPKVVLDVAQPDASGRQGAYLTYELQDVLISSYQTGANSEDGPLDTLAVTFQKVREIFEGQVGETCATQKDDETQRSRE